MNRVTITAPETQRRRKTLRKKLGELMRTAVAREDLQIEYLADPMDQTASDSNREMALYNADHNARLIHDVESALAAIDDGNYGVCARCEEPIPGKRLDAVPWARLCVRCQSVEEAVGHAHARSEEMPLFSYAA